MAKFRARIVYLRVYRRLLLPVYDLEREAAPRHRLLVANPESYFQGLSEAVHSGAFGGHDLDTANIWGGDAFVRRTQVGGPARAV